jgi:hypothetical protein
MENNLTPKAEKAAATLGVKAEAMDAFNECMKQFKADVEANCPEFRILGLLVGVPSAEGVYGVLTVLGPNVSYEGFTKIVKETGSWMEHFQVQ